MSIIAEMLEFNRRFVDTKMYEPFLTSRFPKKKLVVVSCMDTRLVELLPKAMNLKNGDAKFIKTAGGIITHPFGNVMRSILVAVFELKANEVVVVGHHQCGMTALDPERIMAKMKQRGISEEVLATLTRAGIDLARWLTGFPSVRESVEKSVSIVRNHPLLPPDVCVHGMIIDPATGKLELVVEGYHRTR